MQFNHVVTSNEDGRTLRALMSHELNMSSTMIKRIKLYGTLEVNGKHETVKYILREGDSVYACYDDDTGKLNEAAGIPILYEDDYLAVVVKPSGMVTHPVHGHLTDSLLTALNSSDKPLHPVMRLDRETSGLLVVAKTGHVHKLMSEQKITKRYLAAVYGIYDPSEGTIDLPIRRRADTIMIRDVCSIDDPGAHRSVTHYRTVAEDPDLNISLVRFELETGRCHQIRVHSTHMGHPLIGDGLYGPCSEDNPSDLYPLAPTLDKECGRLALHAAYLSFDHPITGDPMNFTSELPSEIAELSPKLLDHLGSQIS
ncbi:MAG: RluA family pseudouridine synthase [Clostridiales bacterium]|nr:RluA family pseudouridine synthase [Clostridiales bacterium]